MRGAVSRERVGVGLVLAQMWAAADCRVRSGQCRCGHAGLRVPGADLHDKVDGEEPAQRGHLPRGRLGGGREPLVRELLQRDCGADDPDSAEKRQWQENLRVARGAPWKLPSVQRRSQRVKRACDTAAPGSPLPTPAPGLALTRGTSAPELGPPCPHLHRDWVHLCHICTGTGLAPPTSAPGPGSPLPQLHRDRAHPSHISTGAGLTPPTPGPGLPCWVCTVTGSAHRHVCAGTVAHHSTSAPGLHEGRRRLTSRSGAHQRQGWRQGQGQGQGAPRERHQGRRKRRRRLWQQQ
jgi:hypothetical protein